MKNNDQYFIKVYEENKDKIYRICLGFIGNTTEASDLNQEILLKIWKNLNSFKGQSNISTWVYRIATNTALLYVKRKNRSDAIHTNLKLENFKIETKKRDYSIKEQEINQLYKAISTLKEIDRIIIGLVLENNSYAEIANITGLSSTNIGARISRIKKTLHKKLK